MKNETTELTEKKSSFLFKMAATISVLLSIVLGLFIYHLYSDSQNKEQKTNTIIVMDPGETENLNVVSDQKIELKHDAASLQEKKKAAKDLVALRQKKKAEAVKKQEAKENIQSITNNEVKQDAAQEHEYFYISIVIDDMGISPKYTKEIIGIKAPLTSSFLTYGKNLKDLSQAAENSGHEIIMHTPMEPKVPAALAPDTLKVKMTDEEIKSRLEEMFSKFKGINIKGINNHMGSLFTESAQKLDVVMSVLKEKNMFFLDSKTSSYSQGKAIAELEGVPYIERDLFLDNGNNYEYVINQLKKTEKKARQKGYAVAIGHPKSETSKALKDWLGTLDNGNIKLVHLRELIALKAAKKL